ncbi:Demethylmenaquinone methyltransferase [Desulfosporosinus acidiphilus SJ4]|uniref:Putative 4-hydroxy-4-methyl-2-oxoglutarate aldolase n=1 Tax=Desulfosporosinus acidiphilus (strain DSM 22704 / JCM 16185 / SJ4) TaxID=646529 RepID=I4D4F8_DESAJ|nr:RraA family protein [Desulfosporosinus acidiphilus]AFM40682.1 Demethylmenaquinone methyltransferase [Desulfosporosinus acidiphilus SJ4]
MVIMNQFMNIPTTSISDATSGLNNLDSTIKPLKETYKISGRAFTVKIPVGENLAVLRAIRNAGIGDILVIDAKGDTYRAIAGDFIVGMAKTLGLGGIVVDGVIRDILGIKQLDFPVFCKGTTVAASSKHDQGEINVPISCGGTTIYPGDIVVGDVDGVVVIPQNKIDEVFRKSLAKVNADQERSESILGDPDKVRRYLDNLV